MAEKEETDIFYHNVADILKKIFPDKNGKPDSRTKAIWTHKLAYDSPAEQLEPIYFWILDFLKDGGYDVTKIVDNFVSSPGGGYFAEIGARATKMQEEGMKILGVLNTVIKSVINIIYDLKEFEIRLKQYDSLKSNKKSEKEAALLGLKQIWMDKVDINRGRGSINGMSYDLGFTTLRDAFMVAGSIDDAKKLDLNERVRRVLLPRLQEFFDWKESSEKELRKRYEIEKNYLRSQYNTVKLYSQWALPYLKAASQLASRGTETADIVNIFNTMVLELSLLAKQEIKPAKEVDSKTVPKSFRDKKFKRKYYSCVMVEFNFRGIPYRDQRGGYSYGGKAEISFQSFALNEQELKLFNKELEKDSLSETLKLVKGITADSLKQIEEEIDHFLGKEDEEEKKDKKSGIIEWLFGKPKKEEKKEKIESAKDVKPDNYDEMLLRKLAETGAASGAFRIYDVYKKSHGMGSFTEYEWETGKWRKVPQ